MANHVYFNINLDLDDGQIALLEKTMKISETENGEMKWKSWEPHLLPIYPVKYNEDDWYGWGCEQMGAKWVTIEDYDSNYMSGHSAWSPVVPLVENLIQYIYDEVGGQPSAKMTYEDEFRNFVGIHECWIEDDDLHSDYEEFEGHDLNDLMLEAFDKEEDWFQSDDFDWWQMYPIAMEGHAYKGEDWEPQQYTDELVYQFFSNGRLEHLS